MAHCVSKDSTKHQKVWDLKTLLKVVECVCEDKKNTFYLQFVDWTMLCEAETPIQVEKSMIKRNRNWWICITYYYISIPNHNISNSDMHHLVVLYQMHVRTL